MASVGPPADARHTVHLALGSVARLADAPGRQDGQGLSASERQRLRSLGSPARRRQFVAGRWLARGLLDAAFGPSGARHPAGWSLSARAGQAPRIDGWPALRLSLAHSGDRVVCAVARMPVGIDVETVRARPDLDGLIALACSPAETALLAALPPEARLPPFYALWTLKEAGFKCAARPDAGWSDLVTHTSRPGDAPQSGPCGTTPPNGWTWQLSDAMVALVAPPDSILRWHGPAPHAGASRWVTAGGPPPG